jgi:hypothetical protein
MTWPIKLGENAVIEPDPINIPGNLQCAIHFTVLAFSWLYLS